MCGAQAKFGLLGADKWKQEIYLSRVTKWCVMLMDLIFFQKYKHVISTVSCLDHIMAQFKG